MPKRFILAILATLVLSGCGEGDPKDGYRDVQRILIARNIGSENSFVTVNRQSISVEIVSPGLAHVRGLYTTRLSTSSISYKMIVRHERAGNMYRTVCFSTNVDTYADPCF